MINRGCGGRPQEKCWQKIWVIIIVSESFHSSESERSRGTDEIESGSVSTDETAAHWMLADLPKGYALFEQITRPKNDAIAREGTKRLRLDRFIFGESIVRSFRKAVQTNLSARIDTQVTTDARYVQLYHSANTLVGNFSTNLVTVLATDVNSSGKQEQKADHLRKLEEQQERGSVKLREKDWRKREKIVKFRREVERGGERRLELLRRRKQLRKGKEGRKEREEIGMMRTTRMNRCTTISLTTKTMEDTLPITDEV